jgi:hypothetical protein
MRFIYFLLSVNTVNWVSNILVWLKLINPRKKLIYLLRLKKFKYQSVSCWKKELIKPCAIFFEKIFQRFVYFFAFWGKKSSVPLRRLLILNYKTIFFDDL